MTYKMKNILVHIIYIFIYIFSSYNKYIFIPKIYQLKCNIEINKINKNKIKIFKIDYIYKI